MMNSVFSLSCVCATSLMVAVVPLGPALARDDVQISLEEIIQNVKSNEALYENLDVRLVETYTDHAPDGGIAVNGAKGFIIASSQTKTHYVQQDGMFRVDASTSMGYADKDATAPKLTTRTRLFDASLTRLLESNEPETPGVANEISGRSDDGQAVRLHMLPLRETFNILPLSVFLQGGNAIRSYPYATALISDGLDIRVEYKGEEEVNGLRCHKVSARSFSRSTGKPLNRHYVLWLAEERNYMVARLETYVLSRSTSLPQGIGEVTAWTELKPGIWCPMAATKRSFDGKLLAREGKQKLKLEYEFTVENVSLAPHYDLAYFQDLKIPDGSAVYHVVDNKVTKSYRQGGPASPNAPTGWMIWFNVAIVLVLVGIVARKYFVNRREVT